MTGALLQARSLTVRRGTREVLRAIDLEVRPAEAVALIGANGAGKSTLLRALAGSLAGKDLVVRVDGEKHHQMHDDTSKSQFFRTFGHDRPHQCKLCVAAALALPWVSSCC